MKSTPKKERPMTMMLFMATEGGRKCPRCGRYARTNELGWIGFHTPTMIVDAYGHLPGFGCNRPNKKTP